MSNIDENIFLPAAEIDELQRQILAALGIDTTKSRVHELVVRLTPGLVDVEVKGRPRDSEGFHNGLLRVITLIADKAQIDERIPGTDEG